MFTFITENLGTILIGVVLAAIVAAIIVALVRKKKSGRTACSCGCQNCAMRDACHKS